jgi:hypothetical protein
MTPLFIINFNIHPEKGGFHAFPQCIQAQGAGGTAVEGVMHDEVEAIELGHIIAHDIAEYEAFEMTSAVFPWLYNTGVSVHRCRYWMYRFYRRSDHGRYLLIVLS